MTRVLLAPNAVTTPLIVIVLLFNAEFGISYKYAPLPLKYPVAVMLPDEVIFVTAILDPDSAPGICAELLNNPDGLLRILTQSRASFVSFSLPIVPSPIVTVPGKLPINTLADIVPDVIVTGSLNTRVELPVVARRISFTFSILIVNPNKV